MNFCPTPRCWPALARRLIKTGLPALCVLAGLGGGGAAAQPRDCPPAAQPLTPALFQAAAAQARDRGLLWRISRDGRTSWLYGTLHVGRAEWLAPGPQVRDALQQSDVVAMELDPLDPAVQREMAAGLAAQPPRALPAPLRQRLRQRFDTDCLDAAALAQGPAEMQAFTLVMMAGRRDGLEVTYGSELLLSVLARGAGRPVVSLESAALQLGALLARDDAEALAMVTDALDDLEAGRISPVLRKTAQVWESGDLAELERYAQWCECMRTELDRRLMKRLLDDRNPGLAGRIDALHRDGRRVFAAVGALHMGGPQGLPVLLAARGYRVERVERAR